MAAFLPALLLCDRWQMQAYMRPPQAEKETLYQLDHTCSLLALPLKAGNDSLYPFSPDIPSGQNNSDILYSL